MTPETTWAQVLAWRLRRQFVAPASGGDAVTIARRLCGVQAQVASSAALAVAVRRADPRRDEIEDALWRDRTLVKTWLMRGTLHLVPADELPVYLGTLASLRFWERPSWQRGHGVSAREIEAVVDAVPRALSGRVLTREELVEAVIEVTGDDHLTGALTSGWGALLKPLSFLGELCYGPPRDGRVTFAAPADWLPGGAGERLSAQEGTARLSAQEGGVRLLRAFLGAHGPATPEMFDTWLFRGATPKPMLRGWFRDLGPELAEVEVEGRRAVLPAEHLDDLLACRPSEAVHLLPGFDQFILGAPRNLEPLLPKAVRPRVSRTAGWISPVVVYQGRVAGVWEAKEGRPVVELFEPVPERLLAAETDRLTEVMRRL